MTGPAPDLAGKRVLIVLTGGIACYKVPEVIRRLKERGAFVRALMTEAATRFVTPLTVGAVSSDRVYTELWSRDEEAEVGHIRLARDGDLVLVAPATAHTLAKMAHGLADDLASTVLLATRAPILAAPAMNPAMWQHPATQANLRTLRDRGVAIIGPASGAMAEPETGPGRMVEPADLVTAVADRLVPRPGPLTGRTAIVTSGPTHEPIDPVRFIANRSSGKQGHAIAEALARAGASVTLVTGPVILPDPPGVACLHVETAEQMRAAVEAALPADIAVCAAAVADWRVANAGTSKIKKVSGDLPILKLTENPDILAGLGRHPTARPALLVGFAAETDRVIEHAQAKRLKKRCDWILANDVSPETGTFGGEHNRVHLITADGVESWPRISKSAVASRLVAAIQAVFTA